MPDILATSKSAKKLPAKPPKKKDYENMLIYKDFDTSLTKVKTPINVLPSMDKTTRKRGEDLIRDRLLAFKIKNG